MGLVDTKHFLGRLRQGLLSFLCASVATVSLFAGSAGAADCQGQLAKLSECRKSGPNGNDVVIGGADCKGQSVYVDDSLDFGKVKIQAGGELCVRDTDLKNAKGQSLRLRVREISVYGALQIGSKDAPIGRSDPANHVYIGFRGERPATVLDPTHGGDKCTDDDKDPNKLIKGLELCAGGVLRLFGDRGAPAAGSARKDAAKVSWTHLSQPAGDPCRFGPNSGAGSPVTNEGCSVWPGGRTLNLEDPVDWRVGDWIVIGTTSFSPFETEFAKITQIDATRKVVTIESPLTYYHFGGLDPGEPSSQIRYGRDKNWGVDERAEVGLITRNITLRGEQSGAPQDHWGGETIIRAGFKEASIQGVEFAYLGKPKLGSYPLHFHMIGKITQPVLMNANSIHHSYNKCVTVHSTQNLMIQNMVCARAVGHLFYQEVGDEDDITFQYNLGLGAMSNNFDIRQQKEVIYNAKPVAGITQGNPGRVTVNNHRFNNGDTARITGVVGMTQVNDKYFTVAVVDANNFTIGVNTTAYTPYSSGGSVNGYLPVPPPWQRLVDQYWWAGDQMARLYGPGENYFALNVGNHDNQENPTHGSCRTPVADGGLSAGREPTKADPCKPDQYYEPASGFWIINPSTKLIGNSIGGCQGVGRAYWYVPPKTSGSTLKFREIGTFKNNRAHSCYAGLYAEPENEIFSDQLLPHAGGTLTGDSVFNVVDGFTVSRMRDRGIWLRPSFWVVKNSRLATNRHSVSLVTAGGVDGTAPGNWALLQDSVLVGLSLNNVDRFGPCPYRGLNGPDTGGMFGCIDRSPFDLRDPVPQTGGEDIGRGYPEPNRNSFGLMIYDGPGRYFRNRFVNFNTDISPYLTAADQTVLGWYRANYANPEAPEPKKPGSFVYEGDAALGWFNANQSSYPNTQASEGLEFENVDLRHQIYTDRVGIDKFNDGDKNTLILDRDGSLTGMKVVGPDKKSEVVNVVPASLNNLPFNASSNSVDECLSTGAQNTLLEGRPTSLISPGSMATVEFSSLFPQAFQKEANGVKEYRYEQILSFSKTTPDKYPDPADKTKTISYHDQMTLHGRNGLGVWEPKVSNGYGYTVSALSKYNAPDTRPAPGGQDVGIPTSFNVGLTDAVLPADSSHAVQPFRVRLAICFTGKDKTHPQPKTDVSKLFQITRGYKAYGSPTSNEQTLQDRNLWFDIKECKNLDAQNAGNLAGCPAKGWAVDKKCPDGLTPDGARCPTKVLTAAESFDKWAGNEESWFYDKNSGYLYLHLVQKVDNGNGPSSPSPTGSCDPAKVNPLPAECPNAKKVAPWVNKPENYYFCPPGGCLVYGVKLLDGELTAKYDPGESGCAGITHAAPTGENLLADLSTGAILDRDGRLGKPDAKKIEDAFPHYALKGGNEAKMCPNPGSDIQPPWGPYPSNAPETQTFQVDYDPALTVVIEQENRQDAALRTYLAAAGNMVVPGLTKGTVYKITLSSPAGKCTTTFVPDGSRNVPTFTRKGTGNCMPEKGSGKIEAHL